MAEYTFKPAGAAIAAIVAGLATPAAAQAMPAQKPDAAGELAAAAARFAPAEPLAAAMPGAAQRDLFARD